MSNQGDKPFEYCGGFNSPELEFDFFLAKQKAVENIYYKFDRNAYTLIYIEHGRAGIRYNNCSVELNENDMFLCKPYEHFELFSLKNDETVFFVVINIHPSVLEECNKTSKVYRVFEPRESDKVCVYKSEEITKATVFFEKAKEYQGLQFPIDIYKSLVTLILFELSRIYDKSHQNIPAKFSHEYDLKIYAFIFAKALTKIKIQDVLDEFFVSKKYVDKVCKKFYGSNFSGMIRSIRMWAARGFIMDNKTNKLEKIAELCGYNDYSVFYKNYKNYFGVTPKEDMMFYKENRKFLS